MLLGVWQTDLYNSNFIEYEFFISKTLIQTLFDSNCHALEIIFVQHNFKLVAHGSLCISYYTIDDWNLSLL